MRITACSYVAVMGIVLAVSAGAAPLTADESVRLREPTTKGSTHQVQIRVQLNGQLAVPAEKGKPDPKPVALSGESAIDYDERILSVDRDGRATRTIRVVRRLDFERSLGGVPQKASLRPVVKRLVLVRLDSTEVPFSPDGPLTWGEIDLLRTDVFTPALLGLLTDREVKVGDRWKASVEAVRELTDFENIDEGGLECRLERVYTEEKRRKARVSIAGTVRGTNEDGQARQQIDGFLTFDLDGGHLSYLSINGKHSLLNADGKEVGKVEGRFVMSRRPDVRGNDLGDEALRGLTLEPNDANTRLLYENEDLKLSFLHPRRWRVSGVQGRQVTLDSADGHGVLMTVEPLKQVPTGAAFLAESQAWLEKQKARIVRREPPRRVGGMENFSLETELSGQKILMDYWIVRRSESGATLAARLQGGNTAVLRREVEEIAASVKLR